MVIRQGLPPRMPGEEILLHCFPSMSPSAWAGTCLRTFEREICRVTLKRWYVAFSSSMMRPRNVCKRLPLIVWSSLQYSGPLWFLSFRWVPRVLLCITMKSNSLPSVTLWAKEGPVYQALWGKKQASLLSLWWPKKGLVYIPFEAREGPDCWACWDS